jgi:NADH-quinone oxidoreductase subunit F
MLGVLQDATNGKGQPEDMGLLTELSESLALGSFCALCGGAADPVVSLLTYFRAELEAHIKEHHCPTGVCQELSE